MPASYLRPFAWLFALTVSAASVGCSADDSPDIDESDSALDYRAPLAREYDITANAEVRLDDVDVPLPAPLRRTKAAEKVTARMQELTRALDRKLWELWPMPERQGKKNVLFMIRGASPHSSMLRETRPGVFAFQLHIEAAAPRDLLERIPGKRVGGDFQLTAAVSEQENVDFLWVPVRETEDAYPEYKELFEGGLDIAIHVGGDHLTPRHDIDEARGIFFELTTMGFRSPVSTFEDLRMDSGPFRSVIDVGGKPVDVRVRLFHEELVPKTELDRLIDAYKMSAAKADIVIYRGHAGIDPSYSGVVVSYSPRTALRADDFRTLDLPSKYQIFVFDGCETYAAYADALYAHPKKNTKNADVVTTVNYGATLSQAYSVRAFLRGVLDKAQGTWRPRTWTEVLSYVDMSIASPWTSAYGVSGLRDNPKVSPLANLDQLGRACTVNTDCGPGIDNLCVKQSGTRTCAVACSADGGCPSGYGCRAVSSKSLGELNGCLPER